MVAKVLLELDSISSTIQAIAMFTKIHNIKLEQGQPHYQAIALLAFLECLLY